VNDSDSIVGRIFFGVVVILLGWGTIVCRKALVRISTACQYQMFRIRVPNPRTGELMFGVGGVLWIIIGILIALGLIHFKD
jgi:hypothetical protein